MLVLSRKVGERLVIGDNITVVVSRVAGNRVTIGIEAPDDVRVIRGELRPVVEAFRSEKRDVPALALTGAGYETEDARDASIPRLAK
jgi:carbon storage regulator